MDVLSSATPLLTLAAIGACVAGVVMCQKKPATAGKGKAAAQPVFTEEDDDDIVGQKSKAKKEKKKQAPPTAKPKVVVEPVVVKKPEPAPVAAPAKKEASKKEEKKAAAPAAKAAPAPTPAPAAKPAAKEQPKKEASKKAEAPKAAAPAKKEQPAAVAENDEVARLKAELARLKAEAAAKAAPAPAARAAPAPAAGNKKEKAAAAAAPAAANAAPAMSQAELDEQLAGLAEIEGWTTIPKRAKSKKATSEDGETPAGAAKAAAVVKTVVEVTVEPAARGAVMGRGGETVKKIMELTGVYVSIPKADSLSKKVLIEGPVAAQVEEARKAIAELAAKGYCQLLEPGVTDGKINVPADKRTLVLGTKGANLAKIQSATGTKINFPERGSTSEAVSIVGDAAGVKAAKAAIKELLADGFSSITHEDFVKTQLPFPAKHRAKLIGTRGQQIRQLENNTDCKFTFPADADADYVVCVGPADRIHVGERLVARLLERIETPVVDVYEQGFEDEEVEEEEEW